jgi:hypothetical protein
MGNVDKVLAANVTGVTINNRTSINIANSHDSAVAIASIMCTDTDLDIGDAIEIELGYSTGVTKVFEGFVKNVDYDIPNATYSISAHDKMVRAVDFFMVSSSAEDPFTFRNKSGEDLVEWVLGMSGLVDFHLDQTYFTFAVHHDGEFNLISSYDYAKQIARILAWNIWMSVDGVVQFANRKPFPMDGSLSQPGDPPFGYNDAINNEPLYPNAITDDDIFNIGLNTHERDLRNKIVVYGEGSLSADTSSSTSYNPLTETMQQILPAGFYKTAVLASPIITSQSFAQDACNYNLSLMNRLSVEVSIGIEGNPNLACRDCVTLDQTILDDTVNRLWYIYQLEHNWSIQGYITTGTLRI